MPLASRRSIRRDWIRPARPLRPSPSDDARLKGKEDTPRVSLPSIPFPHSESAFLLEKYECQILHERDYCRGFNSQSYCMLNRVSYHVTSPHLQGQQPLGHEEAVEGVVHSTDESCRDLAEDSEVRLIRVKDPTAVEDGPADHHVVQAGTIIYFLGTKLPHFVFFGLPWKTSQFDYSSARTRRGGTRSWPWRRGRGSWGPGRMRCPLDWGIAVWRSGGEWTRERGQPRLRRRASLWLRGWWRIPPSQRRPLGMLRGLAHPRHSHTKSRQSRRVFSFVLPSIFPLASSVADISIRFSFTRAYLFFL